MRPRARVAFLILLTLGGILPLSLILTAPSTHGMVRFSSYQDLERFLLTRSNCGPIYTMQSNRLVNSFGLQNPGGALPATLGTAGSTTQTSSISSAPSHSETNNQVAGVDELDTVKNDAQYIYTVSNNTVVVVRAYPGTDAQLVSRISILNQTIDGIFLSGNNLAIVSEAPRIIYSTYGACGVRTFGGPAMGIAFPSPYYRSTLPQIQNTSISVYDLSNRSSPSLQSTVTVNGTFVGARQIGTFAYILTSTPAWVNQTLPLTVVNGHPIQTMATKVYHSDVSDQAFSYTTILALDTNHDNPAPTMETYLLGTSSTIYVSLTNIFLTQPTWDATEQTAIHRISISQSNVKYEATGTVPGHVLNQFSMDEFQGYFRVATTSYTGWTGRGSGQATNVYVLNSNLKIVGRLEGLGQGENFHSARFIGEMGYLVTFKKTDPLFVIELRDTTRPRVLGQLNTTGYSDYLQPLDESHLIGIGKDTVDEGSFAWYQGVKISLFDVSDATKPSEIAKYVIGNRGSDSLALRDSKAILLDLGRNLLVLPVTVSMSPNPNVPNAYGTPVWQGAYVFQVTTDTLSFRGGITHFPSGFSPNTNGNAPIITRELYIGGVLYTISQAFVGMNSLSDLQSLGVVSLL